MAADDRLDRRVAFATSLTAGPVTRMLDRTPKLLSINNYHYSRGGAEVLFLEQNRMLEEAGWQVVPFAMRHKDNLPTPWDEYFPDEIEFGRAYGLAAKAVRASRVIYSLQAREQMTKLLG